MAVTALAAEVEGAGAAELKALSSSTVTATGTSGTVTWTLYDDGELNLAPTIGGTGTLESISARGDAPWYSYKEDIVSVAVSGMVACGSSVTYLFADCSSLEATDLSGFDISSVTDMAGMFIGDYALESLDLFSSDTSSVTYLFEMFVYCYALESLDLSSLDTSKVSNMSSMFYYCTSLTTIYVSELWSLSSVTAGKYCYEMFSGCTLLVGGNGTTYSSSHVSGSYACIDTDDTPGYFTYKAY